MGILLPLLMLLTTASEPLVLFDLERHLEEGPTDSVLRYDVVKLVASLQGLVNRDEPRLVIRFMRGQGPEGLINLDDYWLAHLREGWLADRVVETCAGLDVLLDRFAGDIGGVVLWDPELPATANVAATVCGVEGLLPVRGDSALQALIVDGGPRLEVKRDLQRRFTGAESGSAKCDAYLWAKAEYLDTGRCHPALMAYYIDGYTQRPGEPGFQYPDLYNATLANQDYYIAQGAFFFDLGIWPDEAPVDDPSQPLGTDRATLIALLQSQAKQNGGKGFTTVGGFVPWNLKYTNHGRAGGTHEPVPTEWEYAALLSAHNAIMDADALGLACLTNASAYRHYPMKAVYAQNPRPAPQPLEAKTYVLMYMGDYDSAAWLSSNIPQIWDDPARGKLPMAWAFNPNLSDRVPYVFDHVYATKSPNDWFIAGDSGAGYLNPNLLEGDRLGSGLGDAIEMWVEHNDRYYDRFGLSITGFVINGFHGDMPLRVQEAYARFSPDGVGMQLGFEERLVGETPFVRHAADIYPKLGNLGQTAEELARHARDEKPQFLIFRLILQRPSTVLALQDEMKERYPAHEWSFCDPYTFFSLYREHLRAN